MHQLRARLQAHRGLLIVLAVYLALAVTYSVVTPLFESPDEIFHYPFVHYLATGHGLPVQDPAAIGPWEQEGSQPPLYYILAAGLTRWVNTSNLDQVLQRYPHADPGFAHDDGGANMALHSAAERFPYRGAALAVHLARLFSVLLGAVTVLFSYLVGREMVPRRPGLALAGAAAVAFTPMFLFISASVNNDNLVTALATVALWLLLRQVNVAPDRRRPRRPQPVAQPAGPGELADHNPSNGGRRDARQAEAGEAAGGPLQALGPWLLIGAVIGLAALSKISGLALLPLAALALAWVSWRRRDWSVFFLGGACVVIATAAVAGWWYVRNWRLYGDPLGLNVMVAIVRARPTTPNLAQLAGETQGFVRSYWGLFGWMNVLLPDWVYRLLNGVALAGLLGLAVRAVRLLHRRARPSATEAFRFVLLAAWPAIVFAMLVRWTMRTPASQGRLLFPAIAALSYLLVLGLSGLGRKARPEGDPSARPVGDERIQSLLHNWPVLVGLGLLASVAMWAPFAVIAPAYAPPPAMTAEQQAQIPQRLDLTLGGQMDLLGYRLSDVHLRPGEQVTLTLYWRAAAPMARDYSVFVHLVNGNGLRISQRDVYPGRGQLLTSHWTPGVAIADTYILPIPDTTYAPARLHLEVGLYDLETGDRLDIVNRGGAALGRSVSLGQIELQGDPLLDVTNALAVNLGNRVLLAGYDLDRTTLRPGDTLNASLRWERLQDITSQYVVRLRLVSADGQVWSEDAAWPLTAGPAQPAGGLGTMHYQLRLRPDAPAGVYWLQVSLSPADGMLELAVRGPWGVWQPGPVTLTPLSVLPAGSPEPPEPQFALPAVGHTADALWPRTARLLGFDLSAATVRPGEPLRLTLHWQAENDDLQQVSYAVFVHLLDSAGRIIAQHDGYPAGQVWPTTAWAYGQVIADGHDLTWVQGVQYAGAATLEVGLYDPLSLQRVKLADGNDHVILPVQVQVTQ